MHRDHGSVELAFVGGEITEWVESVCLQTIADYTPPLDEFIGRKISQHMVQAINSKLAYHESALRNAGVREFGDELALRLGLGPQWRSYNL